MRRKIVVLGPLPPPFGGVSLHIVRFLQLLESEGVRANALAYTGIVRGGRIRKLLAAARMLVRIYGQVPTLRGEVLHIHYGGLAYFLALAPLVALSSRRKVVTFHSVRVLQDLAARPAWVRRWALRLLDRFALFVAVRAEIGEALRTLGLAGPAILVMPAFLPPAPSEQDLGRLPGEVAQELLRAQEARRLQVCCGAYYLGPGYGHDDIYGVEELVRELVALTRRTGRELDLWILVSNVSSTDIQKQAEAMVRTASAADSPLRLHLHFGLPLVPVLSRCDAFVRPSREDGDSVAIREALALGLPVLASDVVARPDGVATYRLEGGLHEALMDLLNGLEPLMPGTLRNLTPPDADRYRKFIAEVLGDGSAR